MSSLLFFLEFFNFNIAEGASIAVLAVDLNALLAGLMSARNENSVFLSEVANIAQFLFVKFFLLLFLLTFIHCAVTVLALDTVFSDFVGLAEHFNLVEHLFEHLVYVLFVHVNGWELILHCFFESLEKNGVEGVGLVENVSQAIVAMVVTVTETIHCIVQVLQNTYERR